MNDIYERLSKGETADALVAEFTAALNAAEAKVKEETARKEAEAKAATEAQAMKSDLEDILYELYDWARVYFPALLENSEDEDEDEAVGELADTVIALFKMCENFPNSIIARVSKPKVEAKPTKQEEPFAMFFRTFGL